MIAQIKQFSYDVSAEMKKVSWPSKEQLKESTMVVIIVTTIITLLVLTMDTMVGFTIKKLFDLK
jgi:preprotein translocase subunit SecE